MTKWPMVPLGDVITQVTTATHVHADREYPNFGIYSFGRGLFAKPPISGATTSANSLYQVRAGQFIYSRLFAFEGAYGVVSEEFDGCFISNEYPHFDCDVMRLNPAYLAAYFRWQKTWEHAAVLSTGMGDRRRRIQPEQLLKMTIPLPSLQEQRELVEYLDVLNAKVDEVKRLRQKAAVEAEVLSAVFAKIVERETAEVAASSLLNHLTSHDSGWSPQCDDIPANGEQWAVLKTTSVQWDGFQPKENKALSVGMTPKPSLTVNEGDVLITRAGPVNRVGVACLVTKSHPQLMLSDKIVRLKTAPSLSPPFLTLYMRTPAAQEYFRQGKTGLADSQVNISREKLIRLPIRVPTLSIQRHLALQVQELQRVLIPARHHQQASIIEIEAFLPSVLNQIFGA